MPPEIFFKGQGLLALTSDASLDFTPADFDQPLTAPQREYLQKACGRDIPQVFWRKQVHGDEVLVVKSRDRHDFLDTSTTIKVVPVTTFTEADAYITNTKNLPIAIRTADCVPVFIFDPEHQAVGLAHAGWKGTFKGIAAKTAKLMQERYSSYFSDLKIVLGPSIRQCCYQVGPEFREFFPADLKERERHLYLDVVNSNRRQLLQLGVRPDNIFDCGLCTCCSKNFFSHRRDGAKAARMISIMMLT